MNATVRFPEGRQTRAGFLRQQAAGWLPPLDDLKDEMLILFLLSAVGGREEDQERAKHGNELTVCSAETVRVLVSKAC